MMVKVIHIADIHIKNSRYNEYQYIFNELYKKIAEIKPNIIVVAGDIIDDKNSLDALTIKSICSFITNLSELAPKLVIIQGEHDTYIKAKDRDSVEVLTELINILKPKNTLYFNKTGVYFDGPIIYGVIDPYKQEYVDISVSREYESFFKIGLFYGPMRAELFKNYNIVLGGHNHTRQVYGNIGFAGSLIQQNIGEHHLGHGFILWEDTKYTFHDIYNPYGCVKIIMSNGVDITEKPLPITPREVYRDNKRFITKNNITVPIDPPHEDLIRTILADQKKEIIDKVIKAYQENNANDICKRSEITLSSIKFSNLFCYGENNIVNFNKLYGISGINAKNESGKSSFLRIIILALYGKYSDFIVEDIVRKGCKSGSTHIEFTFKSDEYIIERTFIVVGSSKVKILVNGVDMSLSTKGETDKYIYEIVGVSETIINASFMIENHRLISAPPKERKEIICDALNLNTFKNYNEISSAYHNSLHELKKLGTPADMEKLIKTREDFSRRITKFELLLADTHKKMDTVREIGNNEKIVNELFAYVGDSSIITEGSVESPESLESPSVLVSKYLEQKSLKRDIKNLESSFIKIIDIPNNDNPDKIKRCEIAIEKYTSYIKEYEKEIAKCNKIINDYGSNATLDDYKVLVRYQCCEKMKNIVQTMKSEINPNLLSLNDYKEKIIEFNTGINKYKSKINDVKNDMYKFINENELIKSTISLNEVAIIQNDLNRKKIADITEKLDDTIQPKITYLYNKAKKAIESLSLITNPILENEKASYSKELESLKTRFIENEFLIRKEEERRISYEEETQNNIFLKAYKSVLEPNGISGLLTDFRLNTLIDTINDILSNCSERKITVSMPNYRFNFGDLPVSCASGFRKQAISMATNLALWKLTNGPVLNGLFIDEGLAACDSENLAKMTDFIKNITFLDNMPKIIFLISHSESVKAQIDSSIEIEYNGEYNSIGSKSTQEFTYCNTDKQYVWCNLCDPDHKNAILYTSYNKTHKKTVKHMTKCNYSLDTRLDDA